MDTELASVTNDTTVTDVVLKPNGVEISEGWCHLKATPHSDTH